MSRVASTTERTEIIYNALKSYQLRAVSRLYRWTGTAWVIISDVDGNEGVEFSEEGKRYKYAQFSLVPMPGEIGFSVINEGGKYSDGSGDALAGVLDLDTRIKLEAGYRLPVPVGSFEVLSLLDADLYYTALSGSTIVLDPTTPTGGENYFNDLYDTFGDVVYADDPDYIPGGYFVKTVDFGGVGFTDVSEIRITANCTTGKVYYRGVNNLGAAKDSGTWTYAGNTVNGTAYLSASVVGRRYFQVAVIFDGTDWSSGEIVSALSINRMDYVEWIYTNVYYLDSPTYTEPKSPEIPTVKCSGRDILKRIGEQDFVLEDLSGGYSVDEVIKLILDKAKISYSATSIDDLSTFGDRVYAGGGDSQKAGELLEYCMQILNQSGKTKYRLFAKYDATEDDNIVYVKPVPSDYSSLFQNSYENFESIGASRRNYDRLLQRLTIESDTQTQTADQTLGQATYSTSGVKTLTLAANASRIRYSVDLNSGTLPSIALTSQTANELVFTIGAGTFNLTITVSGAPYTSEPTAWGEWIHHNNMVSRGGVTEVLQNPLVLDDAEASLIAKGFIESFGTPVREANQLIYPFACLVFELYDISAIWSRYLFLDDLYYIVRATHRIDEHSSRSSFNLDDSGYDLSILGSFIYDRQRDPVHGIAMKYDIGYKYDQALGPGAKFDDVDLTVYNNAEYHDVGEL